MIAPHGKIREDAFHWAYVISYHAEEDTTPLRKGLVLECLMDILSCCGLSLLSTDMLLKDRWHDLSY